MKKNIFLVSLFLSIFIFSQKRDSLSIPFPTKYNLELKNNQENSEQVFREWIPKSENWDNYSIISTMIIIKNGKDISFDVFKDNLMKLSRNETVGFKYTELKKNNNPEKSYLIFKCESDSYKNNNEKESQIYFLIKGKTDFFSCIIALKKRTLPQEFVEEWTKVFEESKLVE